MTLNPAATESSHCSAHEGHDAVRASADAGPPLRLHTSSAALLRGGRELLIHHGEHEYRLRLTQNDKLILTK